MLPRRFLFAVIAVGLAGLTAGCSDDGSPRQTLKQFAVDDITNRTSDTAEPVEINDRDIDMSNEDPAQFDDLLGSS